MIGETLSHYKILDKLGAGGMGEVYLAEDTTLKRQVALKVLPPDLAASQERLERFQREAESLAALNHPNIVHVYSVEEDAGTRFITMELVEGKPLSHLIRRGGMPLERIFEIAIPLADALATAHEKGIIHRDLKPANIMVTDEGRVKVLDFGLAKLRQEVSPTVETELPTEPLTEEGRIVGTVPYMSPEQLEGKEIDSRSDIFSLGVILYEMATAERPFQGDSSISLISSIVKDTPTEVDTLRTDLPHHFSRIVRRSLEKEPRKRFQSMLDVHNELADLRTESASGDLQGAVENSRRQPNRRRLLAWVCGVGGLLLLALAGFWVYRLQQAKLFEFRGGPADYAYRQLTFSGTASSPVLSPDGRFLAYLSKNTEGESVVVRDLESGSEVTILEEWDIDRVAWSPDSLHLAVPAIKLGGSIAETLVVPRLGGAYRSYPWRGSHISWSPSGDRFVTAYMTANRLFIHDRSTQAISELNLGGLHAEKKEGYFLQTVEWSPEENQLLVKTFGSRKDYFWLVDATSGSSIKLWDEDRGSSYYSRGSIPFGVASWSPSGKTVLFLSSSAGSRELWAMPKTTSPEARTDPRRLLANLQARTFSVSGEGAVLAFDREVRRSQIWLFEEGEESTRLGAQERVTIGTSLDHDPSVSPDGTRVAFVRAQRSGLSNVFVVSLDDGSLEQATYIEGYVSHPSWSPDGSEIAFGVFETGSQSDYGTVGIVDLESGTHRLLSSLELSGTGEVSWAPGRDILYHQPGNRVFLGVDSADGGPTALSLDSDAGWMFKPIQSSDGNRIALFWNRPESGLYLVSDQGAIERFVTDGRWFPIGWHESRREILALQDRNDQRFIGYAVIDEVTGLVLKEWELPLPASDCSPVSEKSLVCAVPEVESDIWLVENFDFSFE